MDSVSGSDADVFLISNGGYPEAAERIVSRFPAEARADREAWEAGSTRLQAEARADREAWQAEARALHTQAGADREALGRLTGIVEEVRTARR